MSLGETDSQHLLQVLSSLLHLGVDVSAYSLWYPGPLVELSPPLLLWVSCHISHQLQISALRLEPVLDEVLGFIAEAQHEVSLNLQLVDVLNRLVNLNFQHSNFLLVCCRGQETVHLALQRVIHLHINVIARCLLLIGGVHTNHVIDDDGVRVLQQACQFHGNLRELHARTAEDLSEVAVAVDELLLMTVLQLVVLDVEPKGLHDAGSRLCVNTEQTSQPGVQFVLRGLVVEHEQQGAFHIHITGPFDLETIRLLSGGHSVPLY